MHTPIVSGHLRCSGSVGELFLLGQTRSVEKSSELFSEISRWLSGLQASILQERIIAQPDVLQNLSQRRSLAYGSLDDGVLPTWLVCPRKNEESLLSVLIWAIAGPVKPETHGPHLRIVRDKRCLMTILSGVNAAETANRDSPFLEEAAAVFAKTKTLLQFGGTAPDRLARTWLWLDAIHQNYPDLNHARRKFFLEEGMIAADGSPVFLPASTGIGLSPVGSKLCLEGIATSHDTSPRTWLAAGNQSPAFSYGSAFSRAASLPAPTGDTFFISGTAAIDAGGQTIAEGDPEMQVKATIENVRAVFRQLKLDEKDIVQGVAYAGSPGAAKAWYQAGLEWPLAIVAADICRENLLFEIEAVVCPGAKRLNSPEHATTIFGET